MTEERALTKRKQDAPVEWGRRGEIGALADRFAVMLPGAKEMTQAEILTAAQYARVMDLNPFRGEVYFYKDRGKLCVVDGYKALARWAKKDMPYTDRYDLLPTDDGELVKVRCWILREDRKQFLREYTDLGATFPEAFEIAATYADGVVMESETKTKRGDNRTPPTGWTWEQVARKRAFKNAINLSHGAPSPRDIAKDSWEVNGVQTIPEDWDGAEVLSQEEIEKLAELRARTRETLDAFEGMTPEEQAAKVKDNSQILYGPDEDDPLGADTPQKPYVPHSEVPPDEGVIGMTADEYLEAEPDLVPADALDETPTVNNPTELLAALKPLEYYKLGKHALAAYNKVTGAGLDGWPTTNDPKFYTDALETLTNYANEQKAQEVIEQTAEQMKAPF